MSDSPVNFTLTIEDTNWAAVAESKACRAGGVRRAYQSAWSLSEKLRPLIAVPESSDVRLSRITAANASVSFRIPRTIS